MKTIDEIQQAIRDLPRYEREMLAYWAQRIARDERVAEADVAYGHSEVGRGHSDAVDNRAKKAHRAGYSKVGHGDTEAVDGPREATHSRAKPAQGHGNAAHLHGDASGHAAVVRPIDDPERMSVDEYLALEEFRGPRFEYVGGRPYMLGAETPRHSLITGNLTALIKSHLHGRSLTLFSSGVMLHIQVDGDDLFYCPDLMVLTGAHDLSAQYLTDPILVVEVLSPATERVDRREKAYSYRFVPTLQEYVLIAQHAPRVAIHRRSEEWRPSFLTSLDATAELRSLDLSIPLRQIYEGAFE